MDCSILSTVVRYFCHGSFRTPATLGMLTAITVRPERSSQLWMLPRVNGAPPFFGPISATFHVLSGTATLPSFLTKTSACDGE